jgi:hypothetical protein
MLIITVFALSLFCLTALGYQENFNGPHAYQWQMVPLGPATGERTDRAKRGAGLTAQTDTQGPSTTGNSRDTADGMEPMDAFPEFGNSSIKVINHQYYKQTNLFQNDPKQFAEYWVDIEALLDNKKKNGSIFGSKYHKRLSNSYRRAVSYGLSNFWFPFYGQPTRNLTIATGGFVYMGTTMHSWLAATQYIAPLMANFDTSQSDQANILYVETDDFVAVEWREVALRGQHQAGNFTFQVKLEKNGDIYFLYKIVPIHVRNVSDQYHPRKVGVSDAYLMETPVFTFSKKVIYEYHRVEVNLSDILNFTVIKIEAQKVCISLRTCGECMTTKLDNFNCSWCEVRPEDYNEHPTKHSASGGSGRGSKLSPVDGRGTKSDRSSVAEDRGNSNDGDVTTKSFCSDEYGMHRRRQDWIKNHCDRQRDQLYCGGDRQDTHDGKSSLQPAPTVASSTQSTSPHGTHVAGVNTSAVTPGPAPGGTSATSGIEPSGEPKKSDDTSSSEAGGNNNPGNKNKNSEINAAQKTASRSVSKHPISKSHVSAGVVVGVIFIVGALFAVSGWVAYAYNNPHTSSGQLLIRYRPARWRMPGTHGDVRYTASVHM